MDQITWVDASGSTLLLTDPDNGLSVAPGRTGFAMPPVELAVDVTPGVAGGFLRDVVVQPRALTIPLNLVGADGADLRWRWRDLVSRMNPTRGDGTLTVTAIDGIARQVAARYVDGLQGAMGRDVHGVIHQKCAVVLQALQPYWEDLDPIETTWPVATDTPVWFPIFPLTLAASAVLAGPTIDNTGDAPAWPVWTVTGPGSSLELVNDTTGKTLTVDLDLVAGDTLEVDTDAKTVTLLPDTNEAAALDGGSSFWPLEPGENAVRFVLVGSTTDSSVTVSYRRRWLAV